MENRMDGYRYTRTSPNQQYNSERITVTDKKQYDGNGLWFSTIPNTGVPRVVAQHFDFGVREENESRVATDDTKVEESESKVVAEGNIIEKDDSEVVAVKLKSGGGEIKGGVVNISNQFIQQWNKYSLFQRNSMSVIAWFNRKKMSHVKLFSCIVIIQAVMMVLVTVIIASTHNTLPYGSMHYINPYALFAYLPIVLTMTTTFVYFYLNKKFAKQLFDYDSNEVFKPIFGKTSNRESQSTNFSNEMYSMFGNNSELDLYQPSSSKSIDNCGEFDESGSGAIPTHQASVGDDGDMCYHQQDVVDDLLIYHDRHASSYDYDNSCSTALLIDTDS